MIRTLKAIFVAIQQSFRAAPKSDAVNASPDAEAAQLADCLLTPSSPWPFPISDLVLHENWSFPVVEHFPEATSLGKLMQFVSYNGSQNFKAYLRGKLLECSAISAGGWEMVRVKRVDTGFSAVYDLDYGTWVPGH